MTVGEEMFLRGGESTEHSHSSALAEDGAGSFDMRRVGKPGSLSRPVNVESITFVLGPYRICDSKDSPGLKKGVKEKIFDYILTFVGRSGQRASVKK